MSSENDLWNKLSNQAGQLPKPIDEDPFLKLINQYAQISASKPRYKPEPTSIDISNKPNLKSPIKIADDWYYWGTDLYHDHHIFPPYVGANRTTDNRACKDCATPIPHEVREKLRFIFAGYVREESEGFFFPVKV